MRVQQPRLAVFYRDVRVFKLDAARHYALYLSALQYGAGFILLVDMIFMKRLTVRQDFLFNGHYVYFARPPISPQLTAE